MTTGKRTQPNIASMFDTKVNLPALIVATILVFLCVRLLTLLPDQYYFGFAKMVDPYGTNEFLVTPPSISHDEYAALLKRNGYGEFSHFEESTENGEIQPIDHSARQLAITEQILAAGQFNFWTALLLKMLPPFLVSYFIYLVWKEDAMLAAPTAAALTAFLLCWPVVLLWEQAVHEAWDKQRYLFIVLYLTYILLYYHLARLGCIASKLTLQTGIAHNSKIEIDWGKTISSLLSTGVTAGITWIVTMAIAKA
jgi:hypothetical protein